MMKPQVSIVMPVRNVETTIDVAVRSVVAQSLQDWELIAVDDGSTDATRALLHSWADSDPRIRVHLGGPAQGISVRLNQAVELSAAPLIARMDGDDVCYPHRLETQTGYLREHPEVDVVAAGEMVFTSNGTLRGPRSSDGGHEAVTSRILSGIPLSHPTWMGRRAWFEQHRYAVRARGCEDQELLLRAHASSRYANLPDVLLGYREDRIKLRSSLRARLHQSAFLLRYGMRHGQLLGSLAASAAHMAKGARDAAAVAVRREDLVLSRRTRTPTPDEIATWSAMWAELTAP